MSAANEINKNRGRTGSYSDVTYEDDGFFSDVPGSGSLSRSLLALNVYVKNNLLFNEDGSNEIEDVAYFSKESSPNKSIVKYDVDSSSNGEQNSRISQETRGQIKSTSVFSSKVLSEPVKHEYNINTQTDDYKSIRLQDFQIAPDLNCNSDHDPEENSISNSTTVTENDPETDKRHSRTVTNTVVRIEYSDIRQNDASSNNSFVISPRECNGGILSNVVTKAITLITHNGDENVENKHNDARGDYNSIKPLENDDCVSFDKGNDRIYTNLDYNYVNDLNKEKQKNKSFEYEENDTEKQNSQEDAQMLFKSKSYDNLEFKNEEETNTMVVQRHKPFSLKKQDNRHTLHEFSEWGNRTTTYPDVYAPLPYKSPRRYVESDVNIHYRCPVRHDPLPLVPERELARQQAEHMKRLYREQKRNKYLQELQDMQNRRHQDNFTPSQKTVVPLNRYDDADKVLAKALYTFNGQTSRELSFRKGDIIFVRRQIDANWYEGEIHGRIGLFPYNYVEIQKGDTIQVIKKPSIVEGRARAKFDFIAQTNLELPLKKGEVVTLTRRIDQNWWEGRNGLKTGIFPDSYVTILQEPSQSKPDPRPILNTDKPAASPAAHGLLNGSDKRSMGSHSYTPQQNNPALANAPPSTQPLPGYVAKPAQATLTPSERGYGPPTGSGVDLNNTEPLYVDTNAEAIPYRAMYKYRPQNPDELELNEGDTVYVLEKCDDGWYVGSSQRTGRFGTFPGNYVERI